MLEICLEIRHLISIVLYNCIIEYQLPTDFEIQENKKIIEIKWIIKMNLYTFLQLNITNLLVYNQKYQCYGQICSAPFTKIHFFYIKIVEKNNNKLFTSLFGISQYLLTFILFI
jgi:hypothetical protein